MGGAVKDAVGGVLSGARNLLPFSPAKEGPFSGRGWTLYSGRSIAESLADGILDRQGQVRAAALTVAGIAHSNLAGIQAAVSDSSFGPTPAAPSAMTGTLILDSGELMGAFRGTVHQELGTVATALGARRR